MINGLPVWDEDQILIRDNLIKSLKNKVQRVLQDMNPAWSMIRIEAPILMSTEAVNSAYSEDDFYCLGELSLRPETTEGSYQYAKKLFGSQPKKWQRPPVCIWQVGKSFRKEQDQPSKYCRYKEFYQLEFQCIYAASSKCDYYGIMVDKLGNMSDVRTVLSDRLPAYSQITTDLEVEYKGRWLEIASISRRTDFGDGFEVLEIAFGLDRLVLSTSEKGFLR